ncbi:hypothetical protein BDAP_002389 [Binucleata daphniae]
MLISYAVFVAYSIYYSDSYSDSIETVVKENAVQKTAFMKLISNIMLPVSLILDTCVLNYKNESMLHKNYYYALLSPPMNFMLSYLYLNEEMTLLYFCLSVFICFCFGGILAWLVRNDLYPMFCYLYSFVVCCLPSYFFTNEILGFVEFLNRSKIVSIRFSSMTFLSLSCCLGDLIAGIASSRNGLFKTAANACLTAPIHSTLFNLSLILLVMLYKNNHTSITIFYDTIINVALGLGPFIFINLILNYEIRNRKLMNELAYVLLFMYMLYWCFTMLQTIE